MQTSKSKQKSTSATPAKPSPSTGQKNKNNKSTTPGKKRATPAAEPQQNTTQTLAKKIESVRRVTNWPADEDILRVLQESNFKVEVAIDKILSGDAGHPGQSWTEVTYQKKPKETAPPEEKKAASTSKQDRPQRNGGPAPAPKNGRTSENGKDRREPRDQRRDQRSTHKPAAKTGGRGAAPRTASGGRGVGGQDGNYHAAASHSALQASALAATVTPGQTFAARVAQSSQSSVPPPVPVPVSTTGNVSSKEDAAPQEVTTVQSSSGVSHTQTPMSRPGPTEQPSVDLHAHGAQPSPLQPQASQPQTLAQHQPQTQTQRPLTPPQAQPAGSPLASQEQQAPSDYAPQTTPGKPAAGVAPQSQGPIGSPSQGKASQQQFAKGSRRGEAHWKPVQKKESLPAHAQGGITQPRPQEASLSSIGSNLGLMQGAGEPEHIALLETGQDAESFFPEAFDRKDAPFQFGNFGLAPGHKEEAPSPQIRQDTAPVRQAQPARPKEKDQLEAVATPQPQAQPQPQAAGVQSAPRKRSTDKKQQPQYRASAAPQLTEENLHLMSGGTLGGPYPYGHFPFMPQVVPYPLDLSDPAVQAQAHPQMFYDQTQFQGSNTYRTTSTVAPDASKYHAPSAGYREGKYTPHTSHQAQGAAASQAQPQERDRTSQAQPSPQSPPPVHQAQQPPPGYLPGTSQYPIYAYPYQFTYPAAPAAGSQYAYAGQRMPYYKTYGSGSGYPVSPPGSSSHGVSTGYGEDIAQDFGKYQQSQYFFPGEPQLPAATQGAPGAGKTLAHGQATHQHQTTAKTQQQQHSQTQGTQLAYAPPDLPAAYKADYSAAPGGATAATAADGQGRGSPGLSMGHAGSSYYSPQAYAGHYAQGHQAYAYLQQHPQASSHPHAHLLQAQQGQAPPGQASQFS